jgi:hypothetical protein
MKMNKYLQSILLFIIVLVFEAVPFLYRDTYQIVDMKWGWIIGVPIILLLRNFYEESKTKKTK